MARRVYRRARPPIGQEALGEGDGAADEGEAELDGEGELEAGEPDGDVGDTDGELDALPEGLSLTSIEGVAVAGGVKKPPAPANSA